MYAFAAGLRAVNSCVVISAVPARGVRWRLLCRPPCLRPPQNPSHSALSKELASEGLGPEKSHASSAGLDALDTSDVAQDGEAAPG